MEIMELLLGHDRWMTRVLLERCRDLTDEQWHRRFEIGPGSVHDTLEEIVGAMGRWADRIADRPRRPRLEEDGVALGPDELLAHLEVAGRDLAEAARRVTNEGRLGEILKIRLPDVAEPIRFTRAAAIVHVATHGAHHRAQVLNMLRHLGVEPLPDLDAIEYEIEARKLKTES